MSTPLQLQLYSAYLGTEEGIRSILLPDIFSSSGSQNLMMDILGRAKKIPGYEKKNTSAVTTDSGASSTAVVGLFPYRKTASGAITRQLLGAFDDELNEWELKYSTNDGSTWTHIYDAGHLSVGTIPDFAQFDDNVYITNGVIAPRTWDGTTLTTSGGTQSPTPTGVGNGSSGNLSGAYKYKIVSIEGDGTRSPGSATSAIVPVSSEQVDLTWLIDPNTEVIGYEIYRTTGSGSVFYFVTFVAGRATLSYTDDIADPVVFANRALAEHGDAPSTTYFVEPHKGRMWWGKTDDNPTRVWWSDPGDPDSVYIENYLEFTDSTNQGDVLTGMVGNFGEALVVFTEKSLWTVTGTGALLDYITDWNKDRKNTQTGCVSHRSVVRVPAGARYINQSGNLETTSSKALAYFTPHGDIRLFDGQADTIISHPVKDTLQTYTYASKHKIHAVHEARNNQFIWFFPVDDHPNVRKAVTWNYKWGTWYVWTPMPFASSCESESNLSSHFILVGEAERSKGGYIYELLKGTSFDSSAINSIWFTKTLRGVVNVKDNLEEAFSYTKRSRWIDLLFSVTGNPTLTVEWYDAEDGEIGMLIGSETLTGYTYNLVSASGEPIVSASGEQLVAVKPINQHKILLNIPGGDYPHGEGIRIKIYDNSATDSWALEAMTYAYQLLEGLKRRSP